MVGKSVVAEAASALRSAVPIKTPTCCETLTIGEATPLSRAGTPKVAVAKDGARGQPEAGPHQDQRRQHVRGIAVSTPMRVSSPCLARPPQCRR
jgi:hypothetical protein